METQIMAHFTSKQTLKNVLTYQAFCLMCTCIWVLHSALALHPAMSPAYSSSPLSLLQLFTSLSLTDHHLSLSYSSSPLSLYLLISLTNL